MKKELGCPFTLGEHNRLIKNLKVYDNISAEQKEWLDEYMNNNKCELKNVVLQLVDNVLWLITNTGNSIRQFE